MGVQPLVIAGHVKPELRIRPLLRRALNILEPVLAAFSFLVALPFLVAVGTLTAALSRQSPLIAHRRIGRNGQIIWVVKFRTMWDGNVSARGRISFLERLGPEWAGAVAIKSREDPRVTSRFAGFCRRYSIDEIPQLWNVLCGEMSLVGPRPLTRQEVDLHYGSIANELLSVKPGITGLWQISGRSRLGYAQRRRLDLFFIRNWSPELYLKILVRTVPAVLVGKDAW